MHAVQYDSYGGGAAGLKVLFSHLIVCCSKDCVFQRSLVGFVLFLISQSCSKMCSIFLFFFR